MSSQLDIPVCLVGLSFLNCLQDGFVSDAVDDVEGEIPVVTPV